MLTSHHSICDAIDTGLNRGDPSGAIRRCGPLWPRELSISFIAWTDGSTVKAPNYGPCGKFGRKKSFKGLLSSKRVLEKIEEDNSGRKNLRFENLCCSCFVQNSYENSTDRA
jgi:hypothetical protein